ncbi:hypothetical protein CAOG_02733 [Capsaspora owczarzaki ATCC 30864]|uniref:MD-2-related lipid-recognition domain-containing protein n=1 Tax=Capsaspora owczarzaki (strain ATCC 30864) TaxID=595528 RepID=A0A0D2X1Y5_CAPO3|nr:hypothetical protein CAOG_02733 [Capsaspora owczarzaki ATCC 30864]KJE91619.1 hypothetical protein CAOG_002733 [Capsaspora owczarzaki ATCC 30864]|eukprot:XP_004349483.1 hypothetical protein CAOG_02733 [Capsaspora owczarzaki ATCC 30864]
MNTKIAVLALLAVLAVAASAAPVSQTKYLEYFEDWDAPNRLGASWTSCGGANDKFKISSVVVTPEPIVKGGDLKVTFNGVLASNVTAGEMNLSMKWGFLTVLTQTVDVCTVDPTAPCPLAAGQLSISSVSAIPASTPSGTYTATIKVTDQTKTQISCVTLNLSI